MKTTLVAQAIISFCMAFCMTGFFGFLAIGPSPEFPALWLHHFTIAWPVAFCLSMVFGRLGFALAHKLVPSRAH